MHRGVLVFVEVKARSSRRYGVPLAAVDALKQRRLTRMALDYLARSRTNGVPCRFDVVSVEVGARRPLIEVVTNAFDSARG